MSFELGIAGGTSPEGGAVSNISLLYNKLMCPTERVVHVESAGWLYVATFARLGSRSLEGAFSRANAGGSKMGVGSISNLSG